ncbi:hypothetical protein BHE74_00048122 [Ensete ventricosum]|nr:hypothetical protein BHE74_00048122 [Ensete ventricosum]
MVHYRPKSPTSVYKTYLYLQANIGHKANQTRAAKPTASPLLDVQGPIDRQYVLVRSQTDTWTGATGRYRRLRLFLPRYQSKEVNNGRFRPSPPAIGWYQPSCSEKEGEEQGRRRKRENIGRRHPLTTRRWLGFFVTFFAEGRRCLLPENLGMVPRMRRTLRGSNFFVALFSSSPSPCLMR